MRLTTIFLIAAVQAQRGFLVAREYTADARAQAALDPRVQVLDVRKEDSIVGGFIPLRAIVSRDGRCSVCPPGSSGVAPVTVHRQRSPGAPPGGASRGRAEGGQVT
jgi:hypothetical protein